LKKKIYFFIAIGIAAALLSFLLAHWLGPWFYAINTSVSLKMDAPAETEIDICWDENRNECLPLVPYSDANNALAKPGEIASIWLGELPPRPAYYVSLVFMNGVHEAAFHELELDSSTQLRGWVHGAGVGDIHAGGEQFNFQGASYKLINGVYYIESEPGDKLTLTAEITPVLSRAGNIGMTTVRVWMLLFSVFLLFIIPFSLLPRAVKNLGIMIKNVRPANYPWWVYVLCCVAIGFMLLLVSNSAVQINWADPMSYLQLATGGGWFNESRQPGYPLFLGLALWISNHSLNGVILLQAGLLALSTLLCIWILRRWLHPLAAALFILLCLISPAQITYARWIMRESLFASVILLGITALIAHFTTRKPFSEIWLVIYSITCGVAFLIRENGILLPAAILPFLVAEIIKRFISPVKIRERLWSICLLLAHYSIPVLVVGTVYFGFAFYNYLHYRYFQLEEQQKSSDYLATTIFASNFDARSLLQPTSSMSEEAKANLGWLLYSSYIIGRDKTDLDLVYSIFYPAVIQKSTELGQKYNLFYFASILDEIGKSANNLVPWQAEFAGGLRNYYSLISMQEIGGFSLFPDVPATIASNRELLSQLPEKVTIEARSSDPGSIISGYYNFSQAYHWFGILFFLALLSSLYILWCENPLFLAPIAFFIANCFLLIYQRFVDERFITILDFLLILQIALGLSFWKYKHSVNIPSIRLKILKFFKGASSNI